MLAISTRHANLICTFWMKIGGESHTRSQRNLPDFRGDGGDVGDGEGDGDGGGGDGGGDGGDGGDSGDGGCVRVGHPSPPASRQAPLRSSQAPSKRPRCSESSAQERDAHENFQNAPHGSEIFINMFQDASHGTAIFSKFSGRSARERDFLKILKTLRTGARFFLKFSGRPARERDFS